MVDVLAEHLDLRVEQRLVAGHRLELRDQAFRSGVLDIGLVDEVLVAGQHRARLRIEDLFFHLRVHAQRDADLAGEQHALVAPAACGGELPVLLEHLLDLAMFGHQQLQGVRLRWLRRGLGMHGGQGGHGALLAE